MRHQTVPEMDVPDHTMQSGKIMYKLENVISKMQRISSTQPKAEMGKSNAECL